MYIYHIIYIYIYIYIYIFICALWVITTTVLLQQFIHCTLCTQLHEFPLNHYCHNQQDTLFS